MEGKWHVWTATSAFYDSEDPLSFLFALSSLFPIVIVIFVAGIASANSSSQQFPALLLSIGFLYNTALNAILKCLIRSPRPQLRSSEDKSYHAAPSAHGMPSDHAQFMFFFITWLIRKAFLHRIPLSINMQTFLIVTSIIVSYGRVYNNFHTPLQVLVGAIVGIANAYLCNTTFGETILRRVAVMLLPVRDFCTAWTRFIC